jgi:ankyrin repeat protein
MPSAPKKQKRGSFLEDPTTQLIDIIDKGTSESNIILQITDLINQGADVNGIFGNRDDIPLYLAIKNKMVSVVEFLLNNGADINIRNDFDDTPIIYSLETDSMDCFKLLLEYGADCRFANESGNTVLIHYAAKLELLNDCAEIQDDFNRMLQLRAKVNAKNMVDQTALHITCFREIDERAECFAKNLLENGADPNMPTSSGVTPILCIYSNDDITSEQVPFCINIVKMLIDKSADVNARDQTQHNALEYACTQPSLDNGDVFELIKTLFYTPDPNDPMRLTTNEQVVATISQLLELNGHGAIKEDVIQYIKQMTQMRSLGVSSVLQEGIGYYDPDVTRYLYEFMDKKLGGKKKTMRRKNKKRKTRRRK